MKPILTAPQIRQWDAYTIAKQPIASIDLMEQAAQAFTNWLLAHAPANVPFCIFAGMGNNGGDALAIARMLWAQGRAVQVYAVRYANQPSSDFKANEARLPIPLHSIHTSADFPDLTPHAWVIDGLFGSGLSRPVTGMPAALIAHLNAGGQPIVAIDIASGLFSDEPTAGEAIIRPAYTVCFEVPKLAFFMPECAPYVGQWNAVAIGLLPQGLEEMMLTAWYTDAEAARQCLRPRAQFAHKGTFGHLLVAGGSYGKIGAALLAGKGALGGGVGLLTVLVPRCGYTILQTALPEAMCLVGREEILATPPDLTSYAAVAVGPGLGKEPQTVAFLQKMIAQCKAINTPLLLDADALNMLSEHPEWMRQLPEHVVLTPHLKEFARLTGGSSNGFERLAKARAYSQEHGVIVVLKGAYTAVCSPDGAIRFNSTGNSGMATGGSGDVLAGVIAALLAQGYPVAEAAQLGVYLHGLAGDKAAAQWSQEAMTASHIALAMGQAWKALAGPEEKN